MAFRINPALFGRYKTDLINQVYRLEGEQTIGTFLNDGRSLAIGIELSTSWQAMPFRESYRYKGETRVAYLNFTYRLARGSNGPKRQRRQRDFSEEGTLA